MLVPPDPKLLLGCKGFPAPGCPTQGLSRGMVTAPTWVAVVTTETCSTGETCRGAALQALVIPTGCLGAGPGMRHSRRFVPQFGLCGLQTAKSPGAAGGFGQGIGQRCRWGHITGEGSGSAGAGQGRSSEELAYVSPGMWLHILVIEGPGG